MKRIVVLDTNCLIQALPSLSPYHKIWNDFVEGKYLLCVSNEILNEYEEIIGRLSSPTIAKNIIDTIIHSPHTRYREAYFKFRLIEADPDDNKFVDCALAANAEYIVTEDSHFRCLFNLPFPYIKIIDLNEFIQELNEDH